MGEAMEKNSGVQSGQAPHHLPPDTILNGKYMIKRVIGEGGFGITYEGAELNLGLKVAIKEYYPSGVVTRGNSQVIAHVGSGAEFYERGKKKFLDEARILAKFQFLPGIVGVRDFFMENNTAYIVMEYLDGMTLRRYVDQAGGRLPVNRVLELMRPVIASLSQIHKAGLIHRDISPDNIMLTGAGMVKLLDFGAARETTPSGEKSLSVLLKPGYAPEEQYRSQGVQGPWTDVYALSATIYRCITGEIPPEPMERMRWDQLKPPSALGAGTTAGQDAALMKGLALYSENRYQTVEALGEELYRMNQSTSQQNPRPPVPDSVVPSPPASDQKPKTLGDVSRKPSGGRKKLIIGLLALVCVLGGAAVFLLLPKGKGGLLGNSNGNISNFGAVAASSSGFVYSSVDGSALQVMDKTGTWKTAEDPHIGYVNLWENWIYYLGDSGIIERIPMANPEKPAEKVGGKNVSAFQICDGMIYYVQYDGPIRSMTVSGGQDKQLVSGNNSGINLEDGWLYFLKTKDASESWQKELYKVKTDGSGLGRVGTHYVFQYLVEDGWIYYMDPEEDYGLRRMKTDGKEDQSLNTGEIDAFNICGDRLYYTGSEGHSGLYQVKTDGSGERLVDSRAPEFLYEVEEILYYVIYNRESGIHRLYSIEENGLPNLIYEGREKEADDGAAHLPEDDDAGMDEPRDSRDEPETAAAGNDILSHQGETLATEDLILQQILDENMEEVTIDQFDAGDYQTMWPMDYALHAGEFAGRANGDGSRDLLIHLSVHAYETITLSGEDFIVIAINEEQDMKFCAAEEKDEFPMEIPEGGTSTLSLNYRVPDGYQCAFVFTNLMGGTANGPMRMTTLN